MVTNNKIAYFCIDFEDWFHIPYLSKYDFKKEDYETYSDKISDFVDWLDENGILANFFVVGDIAEMNAVFLKRCKQKGHQIECHSFSHLPINKMTDEQFLKDTKLAKTTIESAIGDRIYGYRAPFFSMTDSKIPLLKQMGFSFDSSFIQSSANEYYSRMSMSEFDKVDSLVYEKNGFREYEIPTLKGKPIAGGGFFRLYPLFLLKCFFKKFAKIESNYLFFIHPFEIAGNINFGGLKQMGIKDRLRFQLGRNGAVKKLKKFLLYLKRKGYAFATFQQ